jgi:hypothetical protein
VSGPRATNRLYRSADEQLKPINQAAEQLGDRSDGL